MKLADYVEAAFITEAAGRPDDLEQNFVEKVKILHNIRFLVGIDTPVDVLEQILTRALETGGAELIRDEMAGEFYRFLLPRLNQIYGLATESADSLIYKYSIIGPKFLENAVSRFGDSEKNPERPILEQPSIQIPASDRIVSLNHNDPDYISIRRELSAIAEAARGINDTDISDEQRDRINKGLAAASELWEATELKLIQVKIGVVMAIEDAKPIFKETARLLAIDALIAAIKAFIKATTGVDLENVF